ncbi:MAG: alanine--tRNA ligase-related protein [Candidatus Shikimatogenerans sp. JK-2022]|nr:alanine--tRNA ligase-related protein [Candidatus Shikimatogenerans bostrichidophilus]
MKKYNKIKKIFINFFKKKSHKIIKSFSIINKDKSDLMFINSGINPLKNYFLGFKKIKNKRIANIQKCIRLDSKNNDLEKIGKDNLHHTMFEMLGNWSIGDYDIKKAIKYSFFFLTKILKISKKKIYITVFKGEKKLNLKKDKISYNFWKKFINKKKIFFLNKKDNFWKINKFNLCGPSTEIYINIKNKKINNKKDFLKNKKKNYLIELWNIVNIKYIIKNKKILKNTNILSKNFIDTGMGLERLCMILQKKKSTFEIDLFLKIIKKIEKILKIKYKENKKKDILINIIADHIRTIILILNEDIKPSNNKLGYILRKLIRRILIKNYKYLNYKRPFLYKLVNFVYILIFNKKNKKKIKKIKKNLKKEEIFYFKSLKHNLKLVKKFSINFLKIKKNKIDKKLFDNIFSTYGIPYFLSKKFFKK